MRFRSRPCSRHPRPGLTLVEMVAGMGVLVLLLMASASALVVATRAVPDRASPSTQIDKAASFVSAHVGSELSYATSIAEATPTSITFTFPDRNGDGVDETVRYAWSGKAGAPLTREYNGGEPLNVLDDVHEFVLVYDRFQENLPDTYSESAEKLLFATGAATATSALSDFTINSSNWPAQYVQPTLPAGTAWWKITRVGYKAKLRGSSSGETRIQLREADTWDLPSLRVHDQAVLLESSLTSSYQWVDSSFSRATRLPVGKGVCVVFQWARDIDSCQVQARNVQGNGFSQTITAGSTWVSSSGELPMFIWGTTATTNPPNYRYRLMAVRLMCRIGSQPSARYSATLVPANLPEVSAP